MTIQDRVAHAGSRSEVLLRAGTDLREQLADPHAFGTIAERLLGVAREFGATDVIGGSRDGERIAGAVVQRSSGTVRQWDIGTPVSRLLVLDGVLVTGVVLSQVVSRIRETGIEPIGAAVVIAEAEAMKQSRENLGLDVRALEVVAS